MIDTNEKIIDKEDQNNSNNQEEIKENNTTVNNNQSTDLLLISKNNSFLGRKTLWSQDIELDILYQEYYRHNLLNNVHIKKLRWGRDDEKIFTPDPITSIPENMDINTFENLLRKKKLSDIEKKISTNNYIIDEDNDKDLRTPSPEPIYDPKTGQRINTRQNLNKEKLITQKNNLIAELIQYDKSYKPPAGYKPPKKIYKIPILNNNKYNFTKFLIGPKGENIKKLENISKCKILIKGEGENWTNNSDNKLNKNKNKEELHVLIEGNTDTDIQNAINIIMPYLNENSQEYKASKSALIALINKNSNEVACEFCGEKGHNSWSCPANINQYKTEVVCKYCGDKGHPSIDCPFVQNMSDKLIKDGELNKKSNNDIQNSVLLTGKINNISNETKDSMGINNNIFGNYEENLVNNYAKFLAINANKLRMSRINSIKNPMSTEKSAVNYNYYGMFGGIQSQLNYNSFSNNKIQNNNNFVGDLMNNNNLNNNNDIGNDEVNKNSKE